MLGILAQSYMVATRTDTVTVRDLPHPSRPKRTRRWLPKGHWWLRPVREIDPNRL